jgi:RimJ/RimL family protein N-acetyltransferase
VTEPEPVIRRARVEDAEAYARVIAEVAGEDEFILTEPPVDVEALAERVAGRVAAGGPDALFVVEAAGEIVGNLGLHAHEAGVVTLGMALLPAVRGHGLGRRLLDAGLAHARTREWHKVHLEVFPTNERAVALYRGAGFELEGCLREHYRRRDGTLRDVLVLGLRLPQR